MSEESVDAVRRQRQIGPLLIGAVLLGICALPAAVWLDLRTLSDRLIRIQASETGRIIDDMRGFYASPVVGRILDAKEVPVTTTHNFRTTPGGIPIPATLSIELGNLISSHNNDIKYRFVSTLSGIARITTSMPSRQML